MDCFKFIISSKVLEKCIKSDNHDIQEVLQRVLSIILKAIADQKTPEEEDEEEDDVKNFDFAYNHCYREFGRYFFSPAGVTLFWTLAHYRPSTLDNLLPTIMKTFSKLCKTILL